MKHKLENKILSPQQLQKTLKRLKKNKKTSLVFTNGCFDILHRGHVTYLQKAKSLGSHLIVALDTDSSVKKLKGPSRPINKLKDRMTVMAALQSVDYVTWFSGGSPLRVIKKIMPQILVKGGDWKIHQIIGATFVLANKGKVFSLPFVKGKSTTHIIEKAQRG